MEESSVPKEWKWATVVPNFKKGDMENVLKLKPVSFCKILEKLIRNRMD